MRLHKTAGTPRRPRRSERPSSGIATPRSKTVDNLAPPGYFFNSLLIGQQLNPPHQLNGRISTFNTQIVNRSGIGRNASAAGETAVKGIVFNLLAEAVANEHGEDAWDALLTGAGLDGAYTSLGSYPDAEMVRLVEVAAAMLGCSGPEILRWFGRAAMPLLAERYGIFFEGHQSSRDFVRSVNDIIHPEVRKLYAGAGCPQFVFADDQDGRLLIGYNSPRQLCHLAHGFVEGAADQYSERVELEHIACMLEGNPSCRMAVRWLS